MSGRPISPSFLVTVVAWALTLVAIVAVFAAARWLVRLATNKSHEPDYARRIQGPQEVPNQDRPAD